MPEDLDGHLLDHELLAVETHHDGRRVIRPNGLERAVSLDYGLQRVKVEQLREACARYAARKTTVPGSYAHKHYIETGHAFGFGCCLGTEAA